MAYDNAWLQQVFDECLPASGFDVREEQVAMANFVQTAFLRNRHLLAEAGVGTGKTFAYLIPAFAHVLRTHAPVIVATHTIALQEQLLRDIPQVARLLDVPMQSLLAKGKEHYLCHVRLRHQQEQTPAPSAEEERLYTWSRRTRTGDRSELEGVNEALWQRINVDERSHCAICPLNASCVYMNQRRRWQGANGILVTNHHQFFADMAVRALGHASLFAQPGAIILDEAHALLETAREMLGHSTTVNGLVRAFASARQQLGPGDGRVWGHAMGLAEAFPDLLAQHVNWHADEEATRLDIRLEARLVKHATALYDAGVRLTATLGGMRDTPARHQAIERIELATAALRGLIMPDRLLAWVEAPKGRKKVAQALTSAPRELDQTLATRLFSRGVPVVLTSATLSIDGDFGYAKRQLGLENPLQCSVGSPFDYERQARLYVADDLPDPRDPEAFYRAAMARLKELLEATEGRALVLFTARSRAEQAYQELKDWGRFPIYHQDRATPALVEKFKQSVPSILLGTAFWEGIDVPGEALSCVVIVKLPFPAEDPVLRVKQESVRTRGEDPFEAVLLPEMLLRLKQGAGRLIRRQSDRGVLAILDPRAVTRESYAEAVQAALPPAPRLGSLAEVSRFLGGKA